MSCDHDMSDNYNILKISFRIVEKPNNHELTDKIKFIKRTQNRVYHASASLQNF